MATLKFGQATSTIFNVSRTKYGEDKVYVHPDGSSSTASGWSPTGFLHLSGNLQRMEEEKLIEEFQRKKIGEFTVRELVDFDVVSGRVLEEADLESIPIHPIFAVNMWEKLGQRQRDWALQTPEEMGDGHFIMDNPYVLNAMMPVLTLASAFLSRMHTVPFVDALFLGPREPMDPSTSTLTIPRGLYTFWRRDEKTRTFFKIFTRKNKMGFASGYYMPWDEAPSKENCHGVTFIAKDSDDKETIWIFLDLKLLDLLLRNDLTSAEKAGTQYSLAITMIHELTHAMGFNFHHDPDLEGLYGYEPYFEDSPQCELGFEMENSVFGGIIEPVFKPPAAPLAYRMVSSYPSWSHLKVRTLETFVMDQAAKYNDLSYVYFVPIQTFEDIRKLSFWDTAIRQAARIKELADVVAVYNSTQLSPLRKAASKFIDDIMASASKEERFYDFTQEQEEKLTAIREVCIELHQPSNAAGADQRDKTALLLLTKLEEATMAHKETFNLLEASEAFKNTIFRDRRATIFRWNIGTRRLLNDLLTGLSAKSSQDGKSIAILDQLGQLLAQLEGVRLKIFPPLPTWTLGHEYKPEGAEELKKWPKDFFAEELAELEFMCDLFAAAMESNPTKCYNLAEKRVTDNQGPSSMSFYCRFLCTNKAVVCRDDWMEKDWEERNQVVEQKLQWLKIMREGCTELWRGTFEGWMLWYEAKRKKKDDEKASDEAVELLRQNSEMERKKRRQRF
ncbi:cytochrome b5-like Heme/Steroid binding domain-containing protein [Botrytis cinerea]